MGGSAFSRCAASSPLHRLSPASSLSCIVSLLHRLSCTVSLAPSLLHRLPCTVSPTPPLRIVSPAPLPSFFGGFSPFVNSSSLPGGVSCCLRPDSGAPSACAGTRGRKHSLPPANGRRPVVISLPRGGRTCSLRRRVANASPSHVGGHKKRADLAVRSALRFEGRPGISNPATWKPHRKFSGRWHGEAPALRRSRYPSWSSRRP